MSKIQLRDTWLSSLGFSSIMGRLEIVGMEKPMMVRLAEISDMPGIENINSIINYNNPKEFMVEAIRAERLFVAETSDRVVAGYSMYQMIWGNTPVVSLIKVLPPYRRQGIGSRLLLIIEEYIKARGFDFIVSSTEEVNDVSMKFHLKHTFEPIGSLQMPHGRENYMRKDLTSDS